MVLVQLLLPVVLRRDTEVDQRLVETARELGDAYGGVTAYVRSPAKGVWKSPTGRTDEDEVVMIEVVTEHLDRKWWLGYSEVLAKRFAQDAIHVRALPIELLNPAAS